MTPVYEIKTKHTEKVLMDFIGFSYKVKHPTATFSIFVFAVCLFTISYILRDTSITGMIFSAILGAVIFVFGLTRKKIAAGKLKKADPNYQNQNDILFVFGEKEFTIQDADGKRNIKYGEIAYIYGDDGYYYISVNNELIHMIPKVDFVLGDAGTFYEFISHKTGKEVLPTRIPWKIRVQRAKEQQERLEEEKRIEREKRKRQ